MSRKGRKKLREAAEAASRIVEPIEKPSQKPNYSRYVLWSVSLLVIIAALVTARVVFTNESSGPGKAATTVQPQTASQAGNSGMDSAVAGGGPHIYFPGPSHDFGTIAEGEKVSHTFVVRNTGDAPLRLIKAQGT